MFSSFLFIFLARLLMLAISFISEWTSDDELPLKRIIKEPINKPASKPAQNFATSPQTGEFFQYTCLLIYSMGRCKAYVIEHLYRTYF